MESEWKKVGETLLEKQWKFKDFKQALEFVNKVGGVAEELGHHPDISIKNYKEVFISTTTHSAGHVLTEKDYKLAQNIDALHFL